MKYIDADKLIAEIERQKKAEGWCEVGKDTADVYYARGFRFACDNLLSFVASLQQEQPEVDLEKFISDFFDKKDAENNGRWSEDDIVEAMTNAYELGKTRKEE